MPPLDEYARKRSFANTPEPGPAPVEATEGRRFCIQRHSARRLHYDLRLEIGGTLKSWAVPEGPTLDPSIKRLAVHVEDHPIEYAHFEGNIPKGNYGAGSMMLWDIGTFDVLEDKNADEQLERGDFKFRLHGKKLYGDFALVRLKNSAKGNEWLLIKKQDAGARPAWNADLWAYSARTGRTQEEIALEAPQKTADLTPAQLHAAPATGAVPAKSLPAFFTPMLAASADAPPKGPDWIYEIKWDGVRALCYVAEDGVRLRGRKGAAFERTYPELSEVKDVLGVQTALLDGEVVALDETGRPSFQLLQPRIMAQPGTAAGYARSRPVTYFAFDLLYLNGWDLRDSPLCERRRLLELLLTKPSSPVIKCSAAFDVEPDDLLKVTQAQGLEGIVAKRRMSKYQSTRAADWIKIKVTHEQEFVIAGHQIGERSGFGSLILGAYDAAGKFIYVGNVGTGFDNATIDALAAMLATRPARKCPFGEVPKLLGPPVWARPELVCRVKFNSWTEDKRLRAPVYVGLRNDIDPTECVLESTGSASTPASRPPLLADTREDATVTIDGHRIHFTHCNKVYYPVSDKNKEPYLKRDVINYYNAVASLLIPHWKDRPLSLKRYPDGIGTEAFFQKNAATGFPDWMRSGPVVDVDGKEKTLVIGGGKAELLYLVQLGCIDQNPWMSRIDSLDHPDFLLIDLDPSDCPYSKIVEAALVIRRKLELIGLAGFPKTTGGDGMHIYVPLEPVYLFEQTRAFAEVLCRIVASERPDLFTMPRAVAKRESGKVYFDYAQNARGKTISAPYVLRAHPGAPVATPLDWRELSPSLHPGQFHIRNAMERFDRLGDLFAGVLTTPQRLEAAMEKLGELVAGTQQARGAGR